MLTRTLSVLVLAVIAVGAARIYTVPASAATRGEKRTLRITARWADMWHGFGTPAEFAHKVEVLHAHCADVGRDPAAIMPIAGGSVIDFVMRAEGVTFRHAVELLREGVDLSGPVGPHVASVPKLSSPG